MITSSFLKRIDNVETKLTPKEWAIKLADEIRKYPSEDEFLYSFLNYRTSDEPPFAKPFFALNKQAEEQHPGHKPEDIRMKYRIARKLRAEYQALKSLIIRTNRKMKQNAEIWKLGASLQASRLKAIMLQDALALEGAKIRDGEVSEHYYGFAFPALLSWRCKTLLLIGEFFIFDGIVIAIQEKYFDGHSIIFRDVEEKLLETKRMNENTVAEFNDYLKKMVVEFKIEEREAEEKALFERLTLNIDEERNSIDQKSIVEIAEAKAKEARDSAYIGMLDEMDRHDEATEFLWNQAREELKNHQANQKDLESIRIVFD